MNSVNIVGAGLYVCLLVIVATRFLVKWLSKDNNSHFAFHAALLGFTALEAVYHVSRALRANFASSCEQIGRAHV